eukprot:5692669-Prymnesium_polylepis.1
MTCRCESMNTGVATGARTRLLRTSPSHASLPPTSPGRQVAFSPSMSAGPHPPPPPVDDFRTE